MCGQDVYYYCPICKGIKQMNLGVTQFIKYKGKSLHLSTVIVILNWLVNLRSPFIFHLMWKIQLVSV